MNNKRFLFFLKFLILFVKMDNHLYEMPTSISAIKLNGEWTRTEDVCIRPPFYSLPLPLPEGIDDKKRETNLKKMWKRFPYIKFGKTKK